ncbi:hypothetical protein HAX54_022906 [Datura stramonium]|uniref:Uncharacterized protein n=1 Tax=Datura stramonium TaxID=4076 RepID=A0ABS8UVC6_DATST|nr:hypothetical protein [Datura stramonium]
MGSGSWTDRFGYGGLILSMDVSFNPEEKKCFPFGPVVGEEDSEPPTPWFVATCSNPLSYRPHPSPLDLFPGREDGRALVFHVVKELNNGFSIVKDLNNENRWRVPDRIDQGAEPNRCLGCATGSSGEVGIEHSSWGGLTVDTFSSYPLRTWLPSVYRGHDNWYTRGASASSPLVLGKGPLNALTPTPDMDRTVSRRSEPSSRTALMGEQPTLGTYSSPRWRRATRGAKPSRRCELLGNQPVIPRVTFIR